MSETTTIDLPSQQDPVASVVIPVSAGIALVLKCLASLAALERDDGLPFETIVVLNEISMEDEQHLRAVVSGVQIISSPINLGVAGAANRGRAAARGMFVVLLHDDACVRPGWLGHLVRTADERPGSGGHRQSRPVA